MPTTISSVSFTTTFNLTTTPSKFTFTDTTDYSGPAIPTTGVKGVFKIVSPSGWTIYNNTTYANPGSDIVRNLAATNQITIPLPNLNNQAPEQGTYTITCTVQIIDGVNPTYYVTKTNTYDFEYESPTVDIDAQVDCISPLLVGQDNTDYIVGGITPTNSRTFTLDYPAGSGASAIVNTTSATISTSVVYTGQQSFTVTSNLTYTFTDGLIVIDSVSGTKGILVDCQIICSLYCCLKSLYQQMDNARGTAAFSTLQDLFSQVMSMVEMLFIAIDCGKQQDASDILNNIKRVANCTDDCGCNDGTPRLVHGLGLQNVNVLVQSGNSAIVVTSSVAGGVTTYTLTFSSALITKINASYNTVVVAGTGISVADSGIVNDVRTFTITATAGAPENRTEFLCLLSYVNFAVPSLGATPTVSNVLYSGSNMTGTPTVTATDIANPNWATMNNCFTCSGFQTAANNNYKVDVSVSIQGADYTLAGGLGTWTAAQMKTISDQLQPQIFDKSSGSFKFRLVVGADTGVGLALTNKFMVVYPDIRLMIKISQ